MAAGTKSETLDIPSGIFKTGDEPRFLAETKRNSPPMKTFKSLLILSLCAGLHATSVNAQTLLSNIPGTGSYTAAGNLGLGIDGFDRTKGVGLTIGATSLFFTFMQAIVSNPDAMAHMLTGGIYSNVSGNPGVLLAAFNPVSVASGTVHSAVSLTATTQFTLMANTSYFFVLHGSGITNSLSWSADTGNTQPTANGVTLVGYRFSSNGGSTWASSAIPNQMSINAAPIPEPSTWAMVGVGAAMLVAFTRARRRRV